MDVTLELAGSRLFIRLAGPLLESDATALAERLLRLAAPYAHSEIVIDLTACESIGSLGFGALVNFRLSQAVANTPVQLVIAQAHLRDAARSLRLERIFDLKDSLP